MSRGDGWVVREREGIAEHFGGYFGGRPRGQRGGPEWVLDVRAMTRIAF